jgi:2-aminoadipate transaminase
VLCRALSDHLSSLARWRVPRAGFFVWAEATAVDDTERLLDRAIDAGVTFVPGSFVSVATDGRHRRRMRLSFSYCPPRQMPRAASLLAEAVRGALVP